MILSTNMQKKILMIDIKKVLILFVTVDILLILFSIYLGNNWLISSQFAFFASILITASSFFGYKKMVEKKIASGDIPKEDRDDLEIIDDKHDLYGKEDLNEVIKEERAKITNFKTTALNLGKTATGALSVFRLLSYGALFLSCLYLNRQERLNIPAYLIGLAIVPLTAILSIFFKKIK